MSDVVVIFEGFNLYCHPWELLPPGSNFNFLKRYLCLDKGKSDLVVDWRFEL